MFLFLLLVIQVISKKDQQQYWSSFDRPYQYISVAKFADCFRSSNAGKRLNEEIEVPYNKEHNHPAALATSSYGVKRLELLKANFHWQLLLMKRNSFVYVFKFIQVDMAMHLTSSI